MAEAQLLVRHVVGLQYLLASSLTYLNAYKNLIFNSSQFYVIRWRIRRRFMACCHLCWPSGIFCIQFCSQKRTHSISAQFL